ncbi:adhesin, partial [Actinobacillus pleuropneumoniae]|nr:adhesin [Actinobacillus pleuropneumoniae]MCL7736959.1 adhesin [Actinobacillus pleuropneumoniae]MCL8063566.1 adhesin [Actinobacillus pleuropneumoniae]
PGKDGKDGVDGQLGVQGKDGKTGVTLNGKDGSIGLTGPKGADGKDGANATISVVNGPVGVDGTDGKDGKDGMTRIVYTDPKGTTHNVSTLNDGLNFAGNQGDTIVKKLNETLTVKGALANTADASSENLRVDSQDGALVVKLAQNLANLTTATFGNTDTDKTVVSKDGVTISNGSDKDKTVSLTDKGLNNGNNQITNVTSGLTDSTGQKSDLANATTTNAVNVGDLKDTVNNLTNATTGGFGLKDDNNTEVKQDLGKTIQIKGKDGVTVTSNVADKSLEVALQGDVTVNGKDGKDGSIGVKGADGKDGTKITKDAVVFNGVDGKDGKDGVDGQLGVQGKDGKTGVTLNGKDGAIGINGKDGSNGSITVKQGKPGVDGKDGETKTRIVYETKDETGKPTTEEVATLNDGLKFVGNDGKVVTKELNETLAIKGGINTEAGLTAASDRNVGVRENEKGLNIVIAERPTFSGITVDGKDGKDAEVKFAKDGKDGMSIVGTRGADGQNGLTLKGANGKDGVSFKEDGRITNVADGKDGKDAVNKDQLERVNATANAGWKLTINNGNNQTTVTPNATVDLANTDGNIVITKVGNNVNFGLNNTLTVGNDNKPGTMTVKGENGKDGVSISGK